MRSERWRLEQRDDVTFSELLNALWGRRLLVSGVAVTTMVAVTLLAFFSGPAYVAEAALSVQAADDGLGPEEPVSGEVDPAVQDGSGQSPEALTQRVSEAVLPKELALETMRRVSYASGGLEEFNKRLSIEDDDQPEQIRVSFSAEKAEEALLVANEYAKVFAERTDELNGQGLVGGTLAAEVEVEREAALVRGRATTSLLYGAAAGLAGLVLGSGVAFALESRTRRWRGARDAELTLRAPVLGVIPDYATEEKVG